MKGKLNLGIPVTLISALAFGGCTPASEAPTEAEPAPVTETKAAPAAAAPADDGPVLQAKVESNVVELGASDDMKFDANEIRVEGGKKVTVNLTHKGQLPAASMGHNFVLLKKGVDIQQFALRAMNAADTAYIPAGDEVIAHTKVIGGGESTSVTFDAPEPGTYLFLCTFPGHFAMMQGKFIVTS